MKKRRLIIIIVVLLVLGGFAYFKIAKNQSKGPQYTTATVSKTNLTQTVEATGSVASSQDIALSFKMGGRVGVVNAKVGQHVAQGANLASVIDSDLLAQVDRARAAVDSVKADLAKLVAGATVEDIAVANQQLNGVNTALASAKANFTNLSSQQDQKKKQYQETALQNLSTVQLTGRYTLEIIFDGIVDQEAISNLQTTNGAEWNKARTDYEIAKKQFNDLDALIAKAKTSKSNDDILLSLYAMRDDLAVISEALDYGLLTLAGAVENASYSRTRIDGLKASFNTQATAIAAAKTTIQNSVNDLTVNIEQLKKDLDDAQYRMEAAQRDVDLQQARYQQLIAKPQDYDIQKKQAAVLQAQADLRSVESKLVDSALHAPVSGTITKVDVKVGEIAGPNQAVILMIGDSKLQIDVDIPESDITKITVGQKATITLDAFGADQIFDGTVSFIEPSQRTIQDVVYYRLTVIFDQTNDAIKSGMTATVRIKTAEREGVLAIPLRAVAINTDGTKTVRILTATNTVETKTVTTGIRADDGSVEILSGLSENDRVITADNTST